MPVVKTFFNKESNNNVMTDEHIQKIIVMFDNKENLDHVALSVANEDIAANDYNLTVRDYVAAKDTREVTDITKLNVEIKTTVAKIDQLRRDLDVIVSKIESTEAQV